MYPTSIASASATIVDSDITGLGQRQLGADEGGAIALVFDNGLTAYLARLNILNCSALRGGALYLSDSPVRTVTGQSPVRRRKNRLPHPTFCCSPASCVTTPCAAA